MAGGAGPLFKSLLLLRFVLFPFLYINLNLFDCTDNDVEITRDFLPPNTRSDF